MEKIDRKISSYLQLGIFFFIWIGLVKIFGHQDLNSIDLRAAITKLPQAVGIYFVIIIIFTKWAWHFKIFQGWLVKIPYLQGTWKGELQSSWINPKTNEGIGAIPVSLVIKHDFHKLSCRLFTQESQSFSISADVVIGPEGAICLSYTYTNKPIVLIRDRSAIHDGASILHVLGRGKERALEGSYWTSRNTNGTMNFKLHSNDLEDKFIL